MIDSERHHIEESIAACKAAIEACQTCAAEDIRMATNVCALICLDCADICTATLHTLARRSIHHGDFCAICVHICRACAAVCAPHAEVHEHCRRCMEACEQCAAQCVKHVKERHI